MVVDRENAMSFLLSRGGWIFALALLFLSTTSVLDFYHDFFLGVLPAENFPMYFTLVTFAIGFLAGYFVERKYFEDGKTVFSRRKLKK